ncbi:hypothetical protein IWZ01DRAFT_277832 [Phyllosticta capitalensis]
MDDPRTIHQLCVCRLFVPATAPHRPAHDLAHLRTALPQPARATASPSRQLRRRRRWHDDGRPLLLASNHNRVDDAGINIIKLALPHNHHPKQPPHLRRVASPHRTDAHRAAPPAPARPGPLRAGPLPPAAVPAAGHHARHQRAAHQGVGAGRDRAAPGGGSGGRGRRERHSWCLHLAVWWAEEEGAGREGEEEEGLVGLSDVLGVGSVGLVVDCPAAYVFMCRWRRRAFHRLSAHPSNYAAMPR